MIACKNIFYPYENKPTKNKSNKNFKQKSFYACVVADGGSVFRVLPSCKVAKQAEASKSSSHLKMCCMPPRVPFQSSYASCLFLSASFWIFIVLQYFLVKDENSWGSFPSLSTQQACSIHPPPTQMRSSRMRSLQGRPCFTIVVDWTGLN